VWLGEVPGAWGGARRRPSGDALAAPVGVRGAGAASGRRGLTPAGGRCPALGNPGSRRPAFTEVPAAPRPLRGLGTAHGRNGGLSIPAGWPRTRFPSPLTLRACARGTVHAQARSARGGLVGRAGAPCAMLARLLPRRGGIRPARAQGSRSARGLAPGPRLRGALSGTGPAERSHLTVHGLLTTPHGGERPLSLLPDPGHAAGHSRPRHGNSPCDSAIPACNGLLKSARAAPWGCQNGQKLGELGQAGDTGERGVKV
jgi:hypothetical protein